ncbi:TTAGGG repeat binding factor [Arthrobotrys megalospora]
MARKAGHQKAPSPEIPRGSSSATTRTTRSRRSPPPPPPTQILTVDETEDEAEPRSQLSEEEDEEARDGKGEDINLEADYNAEKDSQEGSEYGSHEEGDGDSQNEHESEHDVQSEGDISEYDDLRSTQNRLDPSILLMNLEPLEKAAGNILDYFLDETKEGVEFSPQSLKSVMALYTYAPEGHKIHGIDPRNIATVLGISHFNNETKEAFDPIFRKANLAAFSLVVFKEEPAKFYVLGSWDQVLFKADTYAGVDNAANFEFIKALRTQMYISAMDMQEGIRSVEHENWPDKILLGAFCDGDQPTQIPFERASKFKEKLEAAKLKGWDSTESGIEDEFRQDLLDHINLLRSYTEDIDGVPTADLKALTKRWSYEMFQDKYLEWLKKACLQISESDPSISWRLDVAKRGAENFETFHENFEQLMQDPYSENPGSRSPSMIQHSRRTTGTSIVEEVRNEPPPSSLRAASNSRNLDRDLRKKMKQIAKQYAGEPGKPISRSSTGLMPPTSTQPRPSQEQSRNQNPRHSAPASVAGSSTGFNINQSLAKATKLEEKENTRPPTKEKKQKFFNETQDGRTSISFSDDVDGSAGPGPSQKAARNAAPPEEEHRLPDSVDDSDAVPVEEPDVVPAKPSRNKRARPSSDDEEETDDFERNDTHVRMRKRPRQGDHTIQPKARRFEPNGGASRPEQRQPSPPPRPQPRPAQPDEPRSPQRNERRYSEASRGDFEPFVPRTRRSWSDDEVDLLVAGIATIGPRWATIRDSFFGGERTDVNLKDKARNLKFEFLKKGETLPEGFQHVTIDVRMLENLRNKGILYKNGDLRPTRLA